MVFIEETIRENKKVQRLKIGGRKVSGEKKDSGYSAIKKQR
jgi:hypothetical protein